MKAKFLRVGESFSLINNDLMKNLVCLRVSPSAIHISGEEKEYGPHDDWKQIKGAKAYISCDTEVNPIKKPLIDVSKNEDQQLKIERPKGKRGRQAKEITFPKTPFTIPELAKINNCSTTHCILKVQKMLRAEEIQVVEEKRKKGARGRAQKVYQISDIVYKK